MKTKSILLALVIISTVGLFSFKNIAEKESSNTALVTIVEGKEEGYLIIYGDGTSELKPCKLGLGSEKRFNAATVFAQIMNELHEKGYRYVGNSPVSAYLLPSMMFEKK